MQISERRVAKKETEIKQGKKKRTQRVRASGELVNETGPRDRFPIRRPPIDPPTGTYSTRAATQGMAPNCHIRETPQSNQKHRVSSLDLICLGFILILMYLFISNLVRLREILWSVWCGDSIVASLLDCAATCGLSFAIHSWNGIDREMEILERAFWLFPSPPPSSSFSSTPN